MSGAVVPGAPIEIDPKRGPHRGALALRTSLIWHDEVLEDLVSEKPTSITLGDHGATTFVVPALGLPDKFAIVRPGNRGYLLTLGEHMRGTICIDGVEKKVDDFVHRGGEGDSPGGFRATPIGNRDWGVVDLDESGDYKLFFQFVPVEEEKPFVTKGVLYAGVAGYLISIFVLALIYSSLRPVEFSEAIFRGALLTSATLGLAALIRWLLVQDSETQAAFVFSMLLHAALLLASYKLYAGHDPFVWPGPRDLTGKYLATRLEPENPPEPPKPVPAAAATKAPEAAQKNPNKLNVKTATKNDQGASGGKGDTERARVPDPKPDPPKTALFTDNNKKVLDNLIERNLPTGLSKFQGMQGELRKGSVGYGPGTGTGVGDGINGTGTTRGSKGHGSGGGGNVDGDFVSEKGPINTGTNRPGGTCTGPNCHGSGPKEVKVALQGASGASGGLTKEEIDRVVRARAGIFRACYQHELNRTPGIGGTLTIAFGISGDGEVKSARAVSNGIKSDEVVSCVKANIMKLKFPAKGVESSVDGYPFVFSQGS